MPTLHPEECGSLQRPVSSMPLTLAWTLWVLQPISLRSLAPQRSPESMRYHQHRQIAQCTSRAQSPARRPSSWDELPLSHVTLPLLGCVFGEGNYAQFHPYLSKLFDNPSLQYQPMNFSNELRFSDPFIKDLLALSLTRQPQNDIKISVVLKHFPSGVLRPKDGAAELSGGQESD